MKKLFSLLFITSLSSVILGGISMDDDITGAMKLINLSGVDWLD